MRSFLRPLLLHPLVVTSLLPLVALCAIPAHADGPAYAESNLTVEDDIRTAPEQKQNPYVLFDGKAQTAWCKATNDAFVVVGFSNIANITHIGVTLDVPKTGKDAGKTDKTDKANKPDPADPTGAKTSLSLLISNGETEVTVPLKSTGDAQTVEIRPALKGKRLHVRLVGKNVAGEMAASDLPCIGELQLKDGNKQHTSPSGASKALALTGVQKLLTRAWIDDPSAPERNLVFAADGTFLFQYEPILDENGKVTTLRGTWQATEKSLRLDVDGKSYNLSLQTSGSHAGDLEIAIIGEGPHPKLPTNFRALPVEMF